MSAYISRILSNLLSRWYVEATIVLGAIMSAMVYDHFFLHNPQNKLLFCLISIALISVATRSCITLIAEIRYTIALFRRQRLSTKTMKAYPEVASRADWLIAQHSREMPPSSTYWHPIFVAILAIGVVFCVVMVCILFD